MKVMTIIGTRPEIIKLSRVIPELDKHFEHILVHTGQNHDYELGDIFFEQMGIRKPDVQLRPAHEGPVSRTAWMLRDADDVIQRHKPDAVLILGDTNSAVAAAYAAKRRHIPIFHMEAGNRCFDDRTPEEVNRRIVDHIADINLPYTEHARRNLLAEGVKADRIIKTGSPMREVLTHYRTEIALAGLDTEIPVHDYVVSCHREENVDHPGRRDALIRMLKELPGTVLFSVHPRAAARLGAICSRPGLTPVKPLGFFEYIHHQRNAKCVISDSGTLTEEAAILGFPAVMIRQSHERPEGMDEGTVVMADFPGVLDAVKVATSGQRTGVPLDYQSTLVSQTVARTIASYTDFVRREVYRA